jgi:hypothetical protein
MGTTTRKRAGTIAYQLYLYVVLFLGYPLLLAVLFALSFLESPGHPFAQIIAAVLLTLFGLALVLGERKSQAVVYPHLPPYGVALFVSRASFFFWIGIGLCGIVAAQLLWPEDATWLNILFWTADGMVIYGPLLVSICGFWSPRRRKARSKESSPDAR